MPNEALSIDEILESLQPTITPVQSSDALDPSRFQYTVGSTQDTASEYPTMDEEENIVFDMQVEEPVEESAQQRVSEYENVPEEERPIIGEVEGVKEIHYEVGDETTARFSGAMWFEEIQKRSIIIGGQGGISSWLTLLLSRMHPSAIYTFDPDTVEVVNLAGQLFSLEDAGRRKCDAINRTVQRFSDYHKINSIPELYTSESISGPIMFCGFDNMAARKVFYLNWKKFVSEMPKDTRKEALYLDGRLNAETFQILCIRGDSEWDKVTYESQYLFSDAEAEHALCSFKQTAFMANMIAGTMTNLYVNHCANLVGGCRTIPFYTSYEADQMYLVEEGGI